MGKSGCVRGEGPAALRREGPRGEAEGLFGRSSDFARDDLRAGRFGAGTRAGTKGRGKRLRPADGRRREGGGASGRRREVRRRPPPPPPSPPSSSPRLPPFVIHPAPPCQIVARFL